MKNPVSKKRNGVPEWTQLPGDTYLVTGTDQLGKRVSQHATTWGFASNISVHRGSKWLVRGGHKYLIQRVG